MRARVDVRDAIDGKLESRWILGGKVPRIIFVGPRTFLKIKGTNRDYSSPLLDSIHTIEYLCEYGIVKIRMSENGWEVPK
jgi:hypothetical protein